MNKKLVKNAFTIPEALILLVVATLVGAALLPALSLKHSKFAVHGKWSCYVDANGKHYVKTSTNGIESVWQSVGSQCVFTPPANAKSFTIKAVAGGGGGAGGKTGDEKLLFESSSDKETYVTPVKDSAYYAIQAVGGGGGGGGMACGEAKNYYSETINAVKTFNAPGCQPDWGDYGWDQDLQKYTKDPASRHTRILGRDLEYAEPNSSYGNTRDFECGYKDEPVPGFRYDLLIKNDERFTQDKPVSGQQMWVTGPRKENVEKRSIYDWKYGYLADPDSSLKNGLLCFASESNYPPFSKKYTPFGMSEQIKGLYLQYENNGKMVCWNLPAQGGRAGKDNSSSAVFLNAGQAIVASVGRGGKGQLKTSGYTGESMRATVGLFNPETGNVKNFTTYKGEQGGAGTDTTIYAGTTTVIGKGGAGGYGRHIRYVSFNNIPVYEYNVKYIPGGGRYDNTNKCDTTWREDPQGRLACFTPGCNVQHRDLDTCTGPVSSGCSSQTSSACTSYRYDVTKTDENGNTYTEKTGTCTLVKRQQSRCISGTHPGPKYTLEGKQLKVKNNYFKVPACVTTSPAPVTEEVAAEIIADLPMLNGTKATIKRYWFGDVYRNQVGYDKYSGPDIIYSKDGHGSGGYGVGESMKSYYDYSSPDNEFEPRLHGRDGEDGYATVKLISYSSGGGGQAGQYINTILKKTGKLTIQLGRGGSIGPEGQQGGDGGNTVIKNSDGTTLFELIGGKGGMPNATGAQLQANYIKGLSGALSPFESTHNKAKLVPFGGKEDANTSFNGVSPGTVSTSLITTYGAGGGGGAGSKTQAGYGGMGAGGAVVIEW